MNMTIAVAAVAAAVTTGAQATDRRSSDAPAAWATTYHAGEAFYHVIANTRFIGTFASKQGACAVNILVGPADETGSPMRVMFRLNASQTAAVSADAHRSLGIACSAGAGALEIGTLSDPETVAPWIN